MRECRSRFDVPDREHTRRSRLEAVVDANVPLRIGLHAGRVKVEPVGIRHTAGRDEQVRPRDGGGRRAVPTTHRDRDLAIRGRSHTPHVALEEHLHAVLTKDFQHRLGHVGVFLD